MRKNRKWKKKIPGLAAILAAGMLLLAGCSKGVTVKLTTGLNGGEMFRIEDLSCTQEEVRLFLMNQKSLYEAAYGENIWSVSLEEETFDAYLAEQLQDFLIRLKTMTLMAEQQGVDLTEEERQAAAEAAETYLAALGEEERQYVQISQEALTSLYEEYRLAERLVKEITDSMTIEVSDDQARVMEVQEIVLYKTKTNEDGTVSPMDDSEIQECRKQAEEAREKAASGTPFTSLQELYSGEASGSIRLTRQDVSQEWEDEIFNLTSGQVSSLLENEDGFYIIYCVDHYLEQETQENRETIIEEKKTEEFYQQYQSFTAGLATQYDSSRWEGISFADEEIPHTEVNFYDIYEEYFGNH